MHEKFAQHWLVRGLLDGDCRLSSLVYQNLLSHLVERLRAQDEEISCLLL
jgi:hypothetical protein